LKYRVRKLVQYTKKWQFGSKNPDIRDDFYAVINLLFTQDKWKNIADDIFEKCNDKQKRNWKDERFKFITNRDEFEQEKNDLKQRIDSTKNLRLFMKDNFNKRDKELKSDTIVIDDNNVFEEISATTNILNNDLDVSFSIDEFMHQFEIACDIDEDQLVSTQSDELLSTLKTQIDNRRSSIELLQKRIKEYENELETMVQAHDMAAQIRDRLVTKIQKVAATKKSNLSAKERYSRMMRKYLSSPNKIVTVTTNFTDTLSTQRGVTRALDFDTSDNFESPTKKLRFNSVVFENNNIGNTYLLPSITDLLNNKQ
jgi:hypothetical protein